MEGRLHQSLAAHENMGFVSVSQQHTPVTIVRLDLAESCLRSGIIVGACKE